MRENDGDWISVQEQIPPFGKIVHVKFFGGGSGKMQLISLCSDRYVWKYKSGIFGHIFEETDFWKELAETSGISQSL
jgi:hypothetical protein